MAVSLADGGLRIEERMCKSLGERSVSTKTRRFCDWTPGERRPKKVGADLPGPESLVGDSGLCHKDSASPWKAFQQKNSNHMCDLKTSSGSVEVSRGKQGGSELGERGWGRNSDSGCI